MTDYNREREVLALEHLIHDEQIGRDELRSALARAYNAGYQDGRIDESQGWAHGPLEKIGHDDTD